MIWVFHVKHREATMTDWAWADGMPPCRAFREYLRTGLRVLATPEEEAMLLGQRVSDMTMNDLEAAYELMFGKKAPRPPGYREGKRP
jgi:hypothetical protein